MVRSFRPGCWTLAGRTRRWSAMAVPTVTTPTRRRFTRTARRIGGAPAGPRRAQRSTSVRSIGLATSMRTVANRSVAMTTATPSDSVSGSDHPRVRRGRERRSASAMVVVSPPPTAAKRSTRSYTGRRTGGASRPPHAAMTASAIATRRGLRTEENVGDLRPGNFRLRSTEQVGENAVALRENLGARRENRRVDGGFEARDLHLRGEPAVDVQDDVLGSAVHHEDGRRVAHLQVPATFTIMTSPGPGRSISRLLPTG